MIWSSLFRQRPRDNEPLNLVGACEDLHDPWLRACSARRSLRRYTGGFRAPPTPDGVPVKIRSSGGNGRIAASFATMRSTEKIRSLVRACRITVPLMAHPIARSSGVSQLVGHHQPRADRREAWKGLPETELRCRAKELASTFRDILAHGQARDMVPRGRIGHPAA